MSATVWGRQFLSSSLPSKNMNIKIYRRIILVAVFMDMKLVCHNEGQILAESFGEWGTGEDILV